MEEREAEVVPEVVAKKKQEKERKGSLYSPQVPATIAKLPSKPSNSSIKTYL